jgi:hypothetical protein
MIPHWSWDYPTQQITVVSFPDHLSSLLPSPPGLIEDQWPPTQLLYLGLYLKELGCKTIIVETHYIDRDYIHDHALFYARSLRDYPNSCQRWHFFSEDLNTEQWQELFHAASTATLKEHEQRFGSSYLGFTVIRPLPGSPVGRTVLRTYGSHPESGFTRSFPTLRDYTIHLAGIKLVVPGLAFQQQDQGVSACATTALWSALQNIARAEEFHVPTPAEITQSASRYLLSSSVGRSLPSEGLTVQQLCEATRAAGLHPLVLPSTSIDDDRAQVFGYISSGFAPVLTIRPVPGDDGHAVCGVGMKLGDIPPQADPTLQFQDAAAALRAVYVHDDRLGPYAAAHLSPWTLSGGKIATGLTIEWPDHAVPAEISILLATIVPLPEKLRMPLRRVRNLGLALAQATAQLVEADGLKVILTCRFRTGVEYRESAFGFGLTDEGLYALACKTVLSRYIGVIELSVPNGPLYDVLLDATETRANPSALAVVQHPRLPARCQQGLAAIAKKFGAALIA